MGSQLNLGLDDLPSVPLLGRGDCVDLYDLVWHIDQQLDAARRSTSLM